MELHIFLSFVSICLQIAVAVYILMDGAGPPQR